MSLWIIVPIMAAVLLIGGYLTRRSGIVRGESFWNVDD